MKPSPTEAPLLLGQVCSEWRDIVCHMPEFWRSVVLRPGSDVEPTTWAFGARAWLDRSGTSPLSIAISLPKRMRISPQELLANVVSSAYRWQHLKLDVDDNTLDWILSHRMPLLHSIKLDCFHPFKKINILPSLFPKFREISFNDPVCVESQFIVPWSQITHISTSGLANTGTHMRRLRACPNLTSYDMTLFFADTPAENHSLVLNSLQRLRIVAWIPNAVGSIFEQLILPALSEICIEVTEQVSSCGESISPAFPVNAFESLLERSVCPLSRLEVKNFQFSPSLVESFQKLNPSLSILIA